MSAIKDDLRQIKDEAKDKLSSDMSDLKSSFSKLRSDVMKLISDSVGVGKSSGYAVKDTAAGAASDAVSGIKDHLTDWQERGGEQVDAIGKKIGENPLASALIAVGVGFLLAKMFSHKR